MVRGRFVAKFEAFCRDERPRGKTIDVDVLMETLERVL